MRYLVERPEAHYTDNYAVSAEKARLNKTVFRLRLKEVVDRCDLRSEYCRCGACSNENVKYSQILGANRNVFRSVLKLFTDDELRMEHGSAEFR